MSDRTQEGSQRDSGSSVPIAKLASSSSRPRLPLELIPYPSSDSSDASLPSAPTRLSSGNSTASIIQTQPALSAPAHGRSVPYPPTHQDHGDPSPSQTRPDTMSRSHCMASGRSREEALPPPGSVLLEYRNQPPIHRTAPTPRGSGSRRRHDGPFEQMPYGRHTCLNENPFSIHR